MWRDGCQNYFWKEKKFISGQSKIVYNKLLLYNRIFKSDLISGIWLNAPSQMDQSNA